MKKISGIFLSVILFAGGCWILPSGDPPEGNITENRPMGEKQIKNYAQAVDYLVTALTVALLENCPGEKIRLVCDARSADLSFRVLRESGKISGNTMTYSDSAWVLKSTWVKETLHLQLDHGGKTVWQETLACPYDASTLR